MWVLPEADSGDILASCETCHKSDSMSQEPPKQPRRPAEEEAALIDSLRKKIMENYESKGIDLEEIKRMKDYDFLRFIRARKYELEPAYNMLMAALEWRTKEKPHLIKESDIAPEFAKGKAFFGGYDKQGRIICWLRVRLHFSSQSDPELTRRMCLWFIERGLQMTKEDVPFATMVFDLSNFSLSNMDYKFVKYLIDVFANYYPDTLGVALVLNSPWLFSGCWALIKPWIDPVTATKVIFTDNKKITDWMDKAHVPKEAGGDLDVDFSKYEAPTQGNGERHDATPFLNRKLLLKAAEEEAQEQAEKKKKKKRSKKSSSSAAADDASHEESSTSTSEKKAE
eukprot:TRINITY_DN6027_c0_g2_i1.p2 TRINITY_DN6027_c0_g2~~TRINITY_DN6027_c0_g2_i1.p2  ORF type:complete len:340 (-),score=95.53 TRINITY_DN6027_c0_g2_i1:1608-2627(-)